jgi:hypothetical protein
MVDIEQLNISLPAGMGHRAQIIAQLTGQHLSQLLSGQNLTGNVAIEHINIGSLAVHHSHSDAQVASTIAKAINHNISQHIGGGK